MSRHVVFVLSVASIAFATSAARAEEPEPVTATDGSGKNGFEFGLRSGLTLPGGKLDGGASGYISDRVTALVPVWADLGIRLQSGTFFGVYGVYGVGLTTGCPSGASCSANDLRLGLEVITDIGDSSSFRPWIGLGVGYERFEFDASTNADGLAVSGGLTGTGWELANVQLGVDSPVGGGVRIGPFVSVGLDMTTTESVQILGVSQPSSSIEQSIHTWTTLGVKLTFDP